MVISELLKAAAKRLTENGKDNARFEATHLLGFVLGMPPNRLVLSSDKDVSKADEQRFLTLIERRIENVPFQYLLGSQEFMGLKFCVSEDVLIPRQDTEVLVEFVLEKYKNCAVSILDIGTGSGCIPISLAHFCKDFDCLGIDISENALALAKKNAEYLNVSVRVVFEKCDILRDVPNRKFDVIVSNPPYIRSDIIPTLQAEVRDFEPILALDGGADGLKFYRRICAIAPKILKKGGLLAFEIGFDQADEVSAIMEDAFENITVTKDLSGNNRIVSGMFNK